MNTQFVQTPRYTPEQHQAIFETSQKLLVLLDESFDVIPFGDFFNQACDLEIVLKKIVSQPFSVLSNIGDACRHSAHIPEVPGQGGTTKPDPWVCPRCGSKTGVPLPKFSSCSHCYGTSTPYPSDSQVQGGNQ